MGLGSHRRFFFRALSVAALICLALVRGEVPAPRSSSGPASLPPSWLAIQNALDLGDWELRESARHYRFYGFPCPLFATRAGAQRQLGTAPELAAIVSSLPTAESVHEFFRLVQLAALDQGAEVPFQEIPFDRWWDFLDPGIDGGGGFASPFPALDVGRLVPFADGWIVELVEVHGDGRWKRLRVFVAPGRYLLENWEPRRRA